MARFPTFLWFTGTTDGALFYLNCAGMVGAFAALIGGTYSWVGLVVAHASLLSLDIALDLNYPWDCLLYESGWLCLFLPRAHFLLDSVALIGPPKYRYAVDVAVATLPPHVWVW